MKLLSSRRVLCTLCNHAPYHFMQSHIRKVHVCLAVTCHLHFWQNDWGLLRATAVTRGWNEYRNKSHHRKLTREKKIVFLWCTFVYCCFGTFLLIHWAFSQWCTSIYRADLIVCVSVVYFYYLITPVSVGCAYYPQSSWFQMSTFVDPHFCFCGILLILVTCISVSVAYSH